MKSYLSLIPISARVHRRQNRMTLLCIIFAVFLVTAVFGMADMGVRMEGSRLSKKHGGINFLDLFYNPMGQTLYLTAFLLFLLVLMAGVFMISGSLNSNVAQRIKFFGMMRCIGMSRQQIIRFVRLEALSWCKTAVPIGLALGIGATWILCASLRFFVGGEFSEIPLFGISFVGIISGIAVGIITVLIAATFPARRAARVSPITAVSQNTEYTEHMSDKIRTGVCKIETSLGIHYAVSAKKNLLLMTGSFALSIILFLSFSVLIDFVGFLMPQSKADSDIDISSVSGSNSIDSTLLHALEGMKGVERVYGRRSALDVWTEIESRDSSSDVTDIISYDEFDLECLKEDHMLKKGSSLSKVYGNSRYVLAVCNEDNMPEIGDKIRTGGEELEVAGLLKYNPFSSDGMSNEKITLIVSSETFTRITGITDYELVMVQTTKDATEKEIDAIRQAAKGYSFQDRSKEQTRSTYLAFSFFVYGFLVMITLVTLLNIMNSISMGVSARIRQYGAMRAVGMDISQVIKMIRVQACTYGGFGFVSGCTVGLLISKFLYDKLITAHFPYAVWEVPVKSLGVILLFEILAVLASVYGPVKRMRKLSVTEILNEQ